MRTAKWRGTRPGIREDDEISLSWRDDYLAQPRWVAHNAQHVPARLWLNELSPNLFSDHLLFTQLSAAFVSQLEPQIVEARAVIHSKQKFFRRMDDFRRFESSWQ